MFSWNDNSQQQRRDNAKIHTRSLSSCLAEKCGFCGFLAEVWLTFQHVIVLTEPLFCQCSAGFWRAYHCHLRASLRMLRCVMVRIDRMALG